MRHDRRVSTLTLIGVLVGALALAACGRKSGLDLPPSAAAAPAANEAAVQPASTPNAQQKTSGLPDFRSHRPEPRVVPKQDLPIDVLLN